MHEGTTIGPWVAALEMIEDCVLENDDVAPTVRHRLRAASAKLSVPGDISVETLASSALYAWWVGTPPAEMSYVNAAWDRVADVVNAGYESMPYVTVYIRRGGVQNAKTGEVQLTGGNAIEGHGVADMAAARVQWEGCSIPDITSPTRFHAPRRHTATGRVVDKSMTLHGFTDADVARVQDLVLKNWDELSRF